MMIKSVELKNFQSHKKTKLTFDPGFNIIVGQSDHGKSAILRAIEWVRVNKPKGAGIIKNGEDDVSAKLSLLLGSTSHIICRTRTTKETGSYSVDDDSYSFMGSNIPPEVDRILQLEDINIQLQLDGHYLILDSAGQAARHLNSITKLDALSNGLAELKKRKSHLSSDRNLILEKVEKCEAFNALKIKQRYFRLERLYNIIVKESALQNKISSLHSSIIDNLDKIDENKEKAIPLKRVSSIDSDLDSIKEKINKLEEINKEIVEVKDIVGQIMDKLHSITSVNFKLQQINRNIIKVKKQLTNCPYCNSRLSPETKRILLNE